MSWVARANPSSLRSIDRVVRRSDTMRQRQPLQPRLVALFAVSSMLARPVQAQASIDGGRSDLPGMKQDIFDQVNRQKKGGGPQQRGKGPPDCPKSDKMSPFFGLAFASGEMYVRVNSTEGECKRLITVGGANYTVLTNASRTCGPAGEWKKRIAEEMSAVFFQGGLEWVKSENETIEVVTEDGTFEAVVSEEKFAAQLECWKRGCGCEQAKNPKMRMILLTILVLSIGGIGWDGFKLAWEKIKGKKPPRHVLSPKGHRMNETKMAYSHHCDICGKSGTTYTCSGGTNYDMCEKCYKEARKDVKAKWKAWVEKHPEDAKKKKGDGEEDEKSGAKSDGGKSDAETDRQSEPASMKATSEADQEEESKTEDKEGVEDKENKDGPSSKEEAESK